MQAEVSKKRERFAMLTGSRLRGLRKRQDEGGANQVRLLIIECPIDLQARGSSMQMGRCCVYRGQAIMAVQTNICT